MKRRKQAFLFLVAVFSFTNVSAQKGNYTSTLTKVEIATGEAPGLISGNNYQDSIVSIEWHLGKTEYNFILVNNSRQTIKVLWDEAAYIGPSGETDKIFHSGVKFIDRANAQVPTSIIKGSKLSDLIAPTSKVYYSQYGSGWSQKLLYGYSRKTGPTNDGETSKILLPIAVGDKTTEYLFEFRVSWIETQKK